MTESGEINGIAPKEGKTIIMNQEPSVTPVSRLTATLKTEAIITELPKRHSSGALRAKEDNAAKEFHCAPSQPAKTPPLVESG